MSAPTGRVTPAWTFGDRIRKARTSIHMDQREFAAALGIKAGALAAWETNRGRPRDIVAIARRVELLTGIPAAWTLDIVTSPERDGNGPKSSELTESNTKPDGLPVAS